MQQQIVPQEKKIFGGLNKVYNDSTQGCESLFFGHPKELSLNLSTFRKDNNYETDGSFFGEYKFNEIKLVQDIESTCKNFIDCDYTKGFFCLEGKCGFVCDGGKTSPGLDLSGASLPCPLNLFDSGFTDLSGRKVCCTTKISTKEDKEIVPAGSRFSLCLCLGGRVAP